MIEHSGDAALGALLGALQDRGYGFVTPTPATHARVLARPDRQDARDLADVFGWSIAFAADLLDADLFELLRAGDGLEALPDGRWRSRYRVSRLHQRLFLHSAYPTDARDAVFFGPDSYRFADLIAAELRAHPPHGQTHIVDIGTGAGVGAIAAATLTDARRVTATDVNSQALRLARINAAAAGVAIETVEGADLGQVDDPIDLSLANPPYIIDGQARAYRDGGGMLGGQVSLDMAAMAVERLAPGGRLILYTGSAIVRGDDPLGTALDALARRHEVALDYRELDPDVFGEELDEPAYCEVDRIAVIAAIFRKP